jgi:hypothetical protein
LCNGEKNYIALGGHETVLEVKREIKRSLSVPVERQILSYEGEELDDGEFPVSLSLFSLISEVHNPNLSEPLGVVIFIRLTNWAAGLIRPYCKKTLELTVLPPPLPQPTMLGIGAGGTIEQHIERDAHDPRIWDLTSSKILNVQIVDSTTFNAVTGLRAPETPITARTYNQMGLPFFKLWRDELAADGTAGEWDSIMGVSHIAAANTRRQGQSFHDSPTDSGERWGMLSSGVWGRLDQDSSESSSHTEGSGGTKECGIEEPHLNFPLVLLDVDDTLPPFRSVVADDD